MNLTPYVEKLRRELAGATEGGGESAIRLTLLDALSAAADEITSELAPGSVELRLRAGEPEFAVTPAAPPPELELEADSPPPAPPEGDEGATARISLRLPEQLKAGIEQAATSERLSVNSWLVRVASAALADGSGRPRRRGGRGGQAYTGWVR